MLVRTAALAVFAAAAARTQSIPASADATSLALVDAQYENSGLNDGGNAGFGIDLEAAAILSVVYPSFGVVENGQTYTVDQVTDAPDVFVTPSEETATWFNSSSRYTLTLADASSLGDPDTRGNYRHFLGNSLTGAAASGSNLTFEPADGTVITSYAAPGPIEGTGPHRYAWLLFTQPENFQAPSNLSSTASAAPWYVSDYVAQTGIQLVAASFFTVQNGDPTGSVASTQAVNTATLSVSSAASSGASSSGSQTASSASPSSTGGGNGASTLALSSAAGVFAAVAGVAAML
ncbi:hypothetical protein JCM10207_003547 [Rhodosporidiobolus poonsookiae]